VPYSVSPLRKNPELLVGMFCKHGAGSVSHIENDFKKKMAGEIDYLTTLKLINVRYVPGVQEG